MSSKRKRESAIKVAVPIPTYTCRVCKQSNIVFKSLDTAALAKLYHEKVPNNYHRRAHEYVYEDNKDDAEIARYIVKTDLHRCYTSFRIFEINDDEKFIIHNDEDLNSIYYIAYDTVDGKKISTISIVSITGYTDAIIADCTKTRFVRELIMAPIEAHMAGAAIIKYCNFEINTPYSIPDLDDEPKDIILIATRCEPTDDTPPQVAERAIHRYIAIVSSSVLKNGILQFKREKKFKLDCDSVILDWLVAAIYTGIYVFDDKIDKYMAIDVLDYLHIVDKAQVITSLHESVSRLMQQPT